MARPFSLYSFWVESVMLSNTLVGRDKSMRFWQYMFRMLSGLTGREFFAKLLYTMSVSRKTLKFYKPVKVAKALEDVVNDPKLDTVDKTLTVCEVGNDGMYALVDHVVFFQRMGGMPWLSPLQVDYLDRFEELFWFGEIVSVICRELRTFLRLRGGAAQAAKDLIRSGGRIGKRRTGARELTSAMSAYPSSNSIDMEAERHVGKQFIVDASLAKRKANLILLFKAIICDLPCALYFLQPAAFRNTGFHKAWCGVLGMLASLVSLHLNWPSHTA